MHYSFIFCILTLEFSVFNVFYMQFYVAQYYNALFSGCIVHNIFFLYYALCIYFMYYKVFFCLIFFCNSKNLFIISSMFFCSIVFVNNIFLFFETQNFFIISSFFYVFLTRQKNHFFKLFKKKIEYIYIYIYIYIYSILTSMPRVVFVVYF